LDESALPTLPSKKLHQATGSKPLKFNERINDYGYSPEKSI
jgi:hypothetical protein